MSSTFDEEHRRPTEGGWTPQHHEALQHLAAHAPIQVGTRCGDTGTSPLFQHLQTSRWLHGVPFPGLGGALGPTPATPQPFFSLAHLPTAQPTPPAFNFIQEEANKTVSEWHAANNNTTLGEQIWKAEKEKEEQRKRDQDQKPKPTFLIETSPLPSSPSSGKEDSSSARRLLEPSSSLSPEETKSHSHPSFTESHSATDSDEDGHRMELDHPFSTPPRPTGTREEPSLRQPTICLPPRPASCSANVCTTPERRKHSVDEEDKPSPKIPKLEEPREDDASSLLLNFSSQSFINPTPPAPIRAEGSIICPRPIHSDGTPFLPLLPQAQNPHPQNGPQNKFQCALCPFSCASKFHFNSHMNTHGDHQCQMCDYTSRTEGRLKKHMRESHSEAERKAKGVEMEAVKEPKEHKPMLDTSSQAGFPQASQADQLLALSQNLGLPKVDIPMLNFQSSSSRAQTPPALSLAGFLDSDNNNTLQTTMASLMEAVNQAVNSQAGTSGASTSTAQPTSLAAALGLEGLLGLGDDQQVPSAASALDQIRAFTENTSMPDAPTLATALGAVSQAMTLGSPEKSEASPTKTEGSSNGRTRSGKQKVYKCKQCPHISITKDEHWTHARTHIPSDKQMNCPQCMFVTEYKHHLEYHIRNHLGSKPFRCEKCAYMCVNKSMLNSHMKSHNNVYQFRCADCTYATKYCHSLKQHLRKYNHRKRAEDGEPAPSTPQTIGSSDSAFQRLSESVGLNGLNGSSSVEMKPPPMTPTTLAQSLGLSPFPQQSHLNYPNPNGPLNILLRHNPLDQLNGLLPNLPNLPNLSNLSGLQGLQGLQNLQQLQNIPGLQNFPQLSQMPSAPTIPLKCTICEYSTGSQEEMIRHNMTHLNLNLLAQQVSQANNQLPVLPPFLSQLHIPTMPAPIKPPNSHDSGIDVVKEESEGHLSPERGESSGCSSSPMHSSDGEDAGQGRMRKKRKLEEISARLSQGKSPSHISSEGSPVNNNDDESLVAEPSSSPSTAHSEAQRTPPTMAHPMPRMPNMEGPLSIFQQAYLAHLNSQLQF